MPSTVRKSSPSRPTTRLSDLRELVAGAQLDVARDAVRQFLSRDLTERERYAEHVRRVVNDMVGLLEGGAAVDVQGLVESFLKAEDEDRKQKRVLEQQAERVFRDLRGRPDAMPLINETVQAILRSVDRLAEVHRDARWRLMTARALHQPSKGSGAIHGVATDADALLKTPS